QVIARPRRRAWICGSERRLAVSRGSERGHAEAAHLLLTRHDRIERLGRWSPADLLSAACANRDLGSVQGLLQRGVSPNEPNADEILPLVTAVKAGSTQIVRYLLQHGADPSLRSGQRTALDYARDTGDWEMIQLLEKRKSSI